MALGYLAVEYQFGSNKPKTAVHGLYCDLNDAESLIFTEDDARAWGALEPINSDYDVSTTPGDTEQFEITPTIIAALVRYHRGMHINGTVLRAFRLYTGPVLLNTPPINHRVELNLPCNGYGVAGLDFATQTPETVATGNVALLIDKSSASFGQEGGQIWLRYAVAKAFTMVGDDDGVVLRPDVIGAIRTKHNGMLSPLLSEIGLGHWLSINSGFGGGPSILPGGSGSIGGSYYVVPNTEKYNGDPVVPGKTVGARFLSGFTFVSNLSVQDAQSRQNNRKAKKPATP